MSSKRFESAIGTFFFATLLIGSLAQPAGIYAMHQAGIEPVDIKPDPTDPTQLVIRTARNHLFDVISNPAAKPLEESSPNAPPVVTGVPPVVTGVTRGPIPEIPVGMSEVIVVATITNSQPYFSGDHKILYKEYTAQINDVLSNRVGAPLTNNSELALVEFGGGAARLPDGRVIRNEVRGLGLLPEVGGRYVMFLIYNRPAECYKQLTLWRLNGGFVNAQSEADLALTTHGRSNYNGMAEDAFINAVRAAIRAQ